MCECVYWGGWSFVCLGLSIVTRMAIIWITPATILSSPRHLLGQFLYSKQHQRVKIRGIDRGDAEETTGRWLCCVGAIIVIMHTCIHLYIHMKRALPKAKWSLYFVWVLKCIMMIIIIIMNDVYYYKSDDAIGWGAPVVKRSQRWAFLLK